MDHVAFTYRFKPGKKEEYFQAHANLWPSQHEALNRAGVKRMVVFCRGETTVPVRGRQDREKYLQISATDPDYERWGEYMATMLDQPYDENEPGIFALLEEKWDWTP